LTTNSVSVGSISTTINGNESVLGSSNTLKHSRIMLQQIRTLTQLTNQRYNNTLLCVTLSYAIILSPMTKYIIHYHPVLQLSSYFMSLQDIPKG
jgi:hypothetical protein